MSTSLICGPGSDWPRAGRSGDRIPMGTRLSAPVQTGPGAHPSFCTMGTGSFPGVKSGRGVTLTPHPLVVPWSRESRAILLPLWAVRPVQSLSACTRVHFTFLSLCSRMTRNKNQEVQSACSELDWNQGTPEEREVHYG
jgi:hypothetical protein